MRPSPTLPPDVTGDEAKIQWTGTGRQFVRSPDQAFADIPGFDWSPQYADVDGMRISRARPEREHPT
ncbi:MAG: hypothetical protein GY745_07325 [Actinomycetia bacterium]|nr:hypothetical protein [Actinomycetes bacterium]